MDRLIAHLEGYLSEYGSGDRLWVAYSGGLDSHVLLHAAARLRDRYGWKLHAVHVDHGLSPNSARWSEHCSSVCQRVDVPLTLIEVDARPGSKESPEAAARHARYGAFVQLLEDRDVLITAHHRTDQAETLLLQLFRGSGPRGMASMPVTGSLGHGSLLRPLLDLSRQELSAYAESHELNFVDDESNFDTGFERNWLRHQIMPKLVARREGLEKALARSAGLCAEAEQLLEDLAQLDYQQVLVAGSTELSISELAVLSDSRQRNLLRYWLRKLAMPTPRQVHLLNMQTQMLSAEADRTPLVSWDGCEIRRYRDRLFAMRSLPGFDAGCELDWDPGVPLQLPNGDCIEARLVKGAGLRQSLCPRSLTVRFRRGGEILQPAGRRSHHKLKKLLQEEGVPPWRRDRLPLIFLEKQLAAVADLWTVDEFTARGDEMGYVINLK